MIWASVKRHFRSRLLLQKVEQTLHYNAGDFGGKVIDRKDIRIIQLEKLVADYKRAMFGARSEKVCPEQYELAFEDIEMVQEEVNAEDEADGRQISGRSRPRKANRGSLPKHLPRIEEVIEPESTTCECGCERHVIGEDVSERLDIIPAPAHLIPGGKPTEATVAHVIVSKYADHLALYRQA